MDRYDLGKSEEEEEEEVWVYDRPAAHKSTPDWSKQKRSLPSPSDVAVSQEDPPQVSRWGDGVALRTQLLCSLRHKKKKNKYQIKQISVTLNNFLCKWWIIKKQGLLTSVRSQHSSQWTCQHWMEVSGVVYVSCKRKIKILMILMCSTRSCQ